MKIRCSPFMYFKYFYPYSALLTVPLIKQAVSRVTNTLGLGADVFALAVAAATFILPLVKVLLFSLITDGEKVEVTEGVFIRRRREFSLKNSVTTARQGFFYRVLGLAAVKIYPSDGKGAALSVTLRRRDMKKLLALYPESEHIYTKKFPAADVILYALGSSSFISGMFVTVPIVGKLTAAVNRILKSGVGGELTSGWSDLAAAVISLLIRLPLLILCVAYTASFLRAVSDVWGFSVDRCEHSVTVRSGLVRRKKMCLPAGEICSFYCRQGFLLSLLRKKSASVITGGYAETRKDSACILPLAPQDMGFSSSGQTLRCKATAADRPMKKYLWILAAVCTAILLPTEKYIRPLTAAGYYLILAFAAVYAAAAAVAEFRNYFKLRVCFSDIISVRGGCGFSVKELHTAAADVPALVISETPFDRRRGVSSLRVYAAGKNKISVTVKNLDSKRIRSILK